MAKARKKGRPKSQSRDNMRYTKKRVSVLTSENIQYVDWKDYNLLQRFISNRAKIRSRRVTGNTTQQQRLVANAIKLAREMALIPYASRVTTQRQQKERDDTRRSDEFSSRSFEGDFGSAGPVDVAFESTSNESTQESRNERFRSPATAVGNLS